MGENDKYNTCFGGGITYTSFVGYLQDANVFNFKQNDAFNEITEHIGDLQIQHGKDMYKEICNLQMIDTKTILRLIQMNDTIGNPIKYKIHDDLFECSPNSIKYIYYGLLNIKCILHNQLNSFDFIEIGGGYGGQCIILMELFKIFNIHINKYILIDLKEVVGFQEKYITAHNLQEKCVFLPYEEYIHYHFSDNSYLLSSYALSELITPIRHEYYNNVLKYTQHGLVIWNNPNGIDLNKSYIEISHSCHNIVGLFLQF